MKPTRGLLLTFSLPAIMQGFTHTAAGQVLPGIYAKHFGLSLGALGVAVLVCKIFDAVTDPVIGVWSDHTRRRSGSRKPWVLGGALFTAVALWLLLRPPPDVTIFYFTALYLAVYAGWTVTEIPYRAWSLELTSDYTGRTQVAVWLFAMALLGAVLVFLVPMASKALGLAPTQEITPQTLALCALLIAFGLPAFALIAVLRVPAGEFVAEPQRESWRELLRSVVRNRPLLYLNAVFLLQSLAAGMTNGVAFLFIDVHLGLGEKVAALLLITVPIAVLSAPVWGWLCNRYEKHRTWAVALAAGAVASGLLGLVPPGEGGFVPLIALLLLNFFFGAASGVAMPALLGDVVDYGRLEYGRDRAGVYYSFYTLIQKAVTGAGMGLGLVLLDLFGFRAQGGEQTATAVFGIQFAYAFLPCLIGLLAVPLMWRFPIGRAQHAEIRARLAA
ncbi:MAG: MFS transporter [Sinimarinibacterium flocculans]|uniref:MFS transporter n=1 Tax=Sinimarinibacterium flocculans TaxID=985250 RepID=UPI003C310536